MPNDVALCLVTKDNDYQLHQKEAAEAAGKQHGINVTTSFADGKGDTQIDLVFGSIRDKRAGTVAVIIETVDQGEAFSSLARVVVERGFPFVALSSAMECLVALRKSFPLVPIFSVIKDQSEIGELQGRKVKELLPNGGRILYVTGSRNATAAIKRADAFQRELAVGRYEIGTINARGWTADDACDASHAWEHGAKSVSKKFDTVVCQSDALALGVRRSAVFPLSDVPIIGCDGLVAGRDGMTATLVVPSTAELAVQLLVGCWRTGVMPKEVTSVSPHWYERGEKKAA